MWWVTLLHVYHSLCWWKNFSYWWTFGEVTGKIVDCVIYPIRLALLSSKMLISPDKLNNLCITDRTATKLQIVVMLIGRLMWVYCQQISNYCKPLLTYWLTDWRHQWLTDCGSCTTFCYDSFSLLWQFCTLGHGIFYMANVNNVLLVN